MTSNGKLTLLSKILIIFPSAIILFINPRYAFIYLIVCFAVIFVLDRFMKSSKQEAKMNSK